jgi:predicted outer membrane repeat protein
MPKAYFSLMGKDMGGIGSGGNLFVNNSLIANNTATGSGGGINSDGNVTIVNSTLSGNTAGAFEVQP